MPFIEALRQLSFSVGKVDFMGSIKRKKKALYIMSMQSNMIDLDLNVLFCCIIYIQLILKIEYNNLFPVFSLLCTWVVSFHHVQK